MKWPKDQVDIMVDAFRQFLDSHRFLMEDIIENYKDAPPMKVIWDIERQVTYDLTCDDNHPAFTEHGRQRRVKYNPDFVLYPKGCHDSHRITMLKHVGKAVGLIEQGIKS